MGTNYYIETDFCAHCGRGEEDYHIGKSSGGWCFSLHVDHAAGIFNLGDIKEKIMQPGSVIVDEYRRILTVDELLSVLTDRGREERTEDSPHGYSSWDEFHRLNGSEMGPNNMLRSKIDGIYCVGHGEGTYDFKVGEFC